MFKKTKATEPNYLDLDIRDAHLALKLLQPTSEEYAQVVDQLTKLYKIKETHIPERVSADTKAIIAANLAGIVLMLQHERAHVIATKALGFVQKLR